MKTKWTPGPWHSAKLAHPENHRLTRIDYDIRPADSHCSVAYLILGQDASKADQRADPAEVDANAALISLAPEMAEALRALFDECESRFDYVEATPEEDGAMAKAAALLAKLESA